MVSRKFVEAVKLSPRRGYAIAHEAGIHPSTLSKLVHGAEKVKPDDPRIVAVAKVLGLSPDACFEQE